MGTLPGKCRAGNRTACFDELVYVLDYNIGHCKILEDIRLVRDKQPHLHIIVSGRNAPPELVEAAILLRR